MIRCYFVVLQFDQVERDLHLCEHDHLAGNSTSEYHHIIQTYCHIVQEYVPQVFSPQFRNPCWYSHYPYTDTKCERVPVKISIYQHFNTNRHRDHLYCLPAFFLAGFLKCATTTLYDMIVQHPDIAPPKCKEGQFWPTFIKRHSRKEKKMKQVLWYLSHFSSPTKVIQSRPQAITLDASTHTLWRYTSEKRSDSEVCLVPSMIMNVLPNAKFIVIMRDPTKRLFSDYWFRCAQSRVWKRKEDHIRYYSAIAQETFHNITAHAINLFQSCIERGTSRFECVRKVTSVKDVTGCVSLHLGVGMYYYHIVPWLNVFPRENFLFLKTEDLVSHPDEEMTKVWAFLGLHSLPKIEHKFSNSNKWIQNPLYKKKFTMLPATRQMLHKFYQPHNELLAHLLSDSKYMWSDILTK